MKKPKNQDVILIRNITAEDLKYLSEFMEKEKVNVRSRAVIRLIRKFLYPKTQMPELGLDIDMYCLHGISCLVAANRKSEEFIKYIGQHDNTLFLSALELDKFYFKLKEVCNEINELFLRGADIEIIRYDMQFAVKHTTSYDSFCRIYFTKINNIYTSPN